MRVGEKPAATSMRNPIKQYGTGGLLQPLPFIFWNRPCHFFLEITVIQKNTCTRIPGMTAIVGSSMICIMIINILAHSYLYLDLLDMSNVCLLVGFDEQAQILHTWKIQVYSILVTCKDTLPETNIAPVGK